MRAGLLLLLAAWALPGAGPQPYFAEPSISPDGAEIAFVSGGDIWTVPAAGGEARLLVSHPATESRPLYSPDGTRLAFTSTRTGNGDIYVLTFATGQLQRLTFDDANELVEGWSRDGQWVYFSSSARDIGGMTDIYRVGASGGTPMLVSADRYLAEYFAAPSPDGQTLAFNARGFAALQWWRRGHSHLDESEIWLRREGSPAKYERVTDGGAKEVWPMWAKDGRSLFYVSDRSGAPNVWQRALDGKPRQITKFTDGRVVWPAISADGRTLVFERDFRVWKMDTASGKSAAVTITRRGAPAGPAVQHVSLSGQFQELALSPDGKKVAFTSHGEVFAASAKEASDAARVTRTPAAESELAWSPDSRKLAYISDRTGTPEVFLYDFGTSQETQLTTAGPDAEPRFSPDGKLLAFLRDARELRVLDLAAHQERTVATGQFERSPGPQDSPYTWSPDSQWLAYFNVTGKSFSNAWVVPAAAGTSQPVSFLANVFSDGVSWSADGKYLLLTTRQRTEDGKVARIDLTPRTPRFREDQFSDLFKDVPKSSQPSEKEATPAGSAAKAAEKPAPQPVKIVSDGIRERLTLLPVGMDVDSVAISPDGKWAVMVGNAAGQQNLYSYPLDELAKDPPVARQLTSTPGGKRWIRFSPDSKDVFYLDRGSISSVNLESRQVKSLAVTADMDVDFAREKMEVFQQAWSDIRDYFFDPQFHGADWNAVRATYEPLVAAATTSDELRRLLTLMVGELNASHLGANAPGNNQATTGRLGVRFDRTAYEQSGKLTVTEVIPLSPADVAGIKVGDRIEKVDGAPADGHANLDELLDHKIGKRVALQLADREAVLSPVNLATEKRLLYREWVNQNRAYVARVSGGKLGYVHMQDMSQDSLDQLLIDLDAENQSRQGVVIDIRNNTGGFVNAYALDIFARRPYLRMTERGRTEAPARTVLGQRALEAPTILVVNQHSLSDAEDFTEGYRALKLGKVVGEPTAGWIIYTGGVALMDGTVFRLPRIRIQGANGEDMELHPRPVDLQVSRPVGETFTGADSQLDAAVKELLAELPAK